MESGFCSSADLHFKARVMFNAQFPTPQYSFVRLCLVGLAAAERLTDFHADSFAKRKEAHTVTLTHEDLLSISNLLDIKIQAGLQVELQPVKDSIRDLRFFIQSELELIKNDIRNLYAELQAVKDDIRNLYAELQAVKDDIGGLHSEMQTVKDDVSSLTYRVTRLELHIENVTDKNIQLLAENYVPAAKRYEKASAQIDAIQADIEIIKGAIEHHSEALHKLA
ncbi:hypothetical protein [uncultured Acetatifactor sp.]|uniref:hypothetical protein n=1 Tax=uncultured Acetatifactor sp. TaxID=1671927 RepID=UPI00260FDD5A|nr:hypothetical protein [uncultured Acetatifactor sp.]